MLRDASLPRSSWGRGHTGAQSSDITATGLGTGPDCWFWQVGLVGQSGSQKSSECPQPPAASGPLRAGACRSKGGRFGTRGNHSLAPTPLLSLFAQLPKASIVSSDSFPSAAKLKAVANWGAEEQEWEDRRADCRVVVEAAGWGCPGSRAPFLPGDARLGFAARLSQELWLTAAPGAEL